MTLVHTIFQGVVLQWASAEIEKGGENAVKMDRDVWEQMLPKVNVPLRSVNSAAVDRICAAMQALTAENKEKGVT